MTEDILRKILYTAQDEENSDLELVSKDLYMTSEEKPTEHVFRFSTDVDREFQAYVMEELDKTNHTVKKEVNKQFRVIVNS